VSFTLLSFIIVLLCIWLFLFYSYMLCQLYYFD
jgi:hypothetical protein